MALNHKFIIFFILATAHLIKAHVENRSFASDPDFRYPYKGKTLPEQPKYEQIRNEEPVIRPVTLPVSYHSFKFSNVGLQKIGRHFINSNDIIDLSLDNNNINDISPFAFRNMWNLRRLNLSGNKIPTEKLLLLTGNTKLQTLIIDNNNDNYNTNTSVLKECELFQSLKHLHLCNNQLQDIQVPFYDATPILSHLYLSNNSISSDSFFDNIPVSLTHLYLDRNLIDQIGQEKLRHLRELIMDNNIITQICFDECQEKSISLKSAIRMQNLSLSRNLISEVSPNAFSDMNQLLNLDLSGNMIDVLDKETFNSTIRMTSLSLANNILTTVPFVCPMLYLKNLNLTGNRISTISTNTFCFLRDLEYLYLSNNIITTIETRAFHLQNLKYLDLSGNKLKHLPTQCTYPRFIQELHLERNKFIEMDDLNLVDIESLRNVYLDENPMSILTIESIKLLSKHLTLHFKNMRVDDQCEQCQCDNDDDESDPNENSDEF